MLTASSTTASAALPKFKPTKWMALIEWPLWSTAKVEWPVWRRNPRASYWPDCNIPAIAGFDATLHHRNPITVYGFPQ
jgi:hypothetical protein